LVAPLSLKVLAEKKVCHPVRDREWIGRQLCVYVATVSRNYYCTDYFILFITSLSWQYNVCLLAAMTDVDKSPIIISKRQPQLHQDAPVSESLDIYRGRTPSPATIIRPLSPDDGVSSQSSLPESMLGRGRLGALAAVVELAITRWARGNSYASSSSSSSGSSDVAMSQPQRARLRKHRSSTGTLQTVQSEWDIAARIRWLKAREEQRQIPREFALYLPPSLSAGTPLHESMMRRITRTTSLSLILAQLDSTLKLNPKPRRTHQQNRVPRGRPHPAYHDHSSIAGAMLSARFTSWEPTICIKESLEMVLAQETGKNQ